MKGPPAGILEEQPSRGRTDLREDDGIDPEAIVAAARRRQRRRRTRITVVGLIALTAFAGWGLIGSRSGGPPVGEIEARAAAALHGERGGLILLEQKQPELQNLPHFPPGFDVSRCFGCGLTKTWIDLATGNRRDLYYSPGRRLVGQDTEALLRHEYFAQGQVNYRTRTWSKATLLLRSAKTRAQIARSLSPLNEANLLATEAGNLTFKLIGRQTVDGQPTLHLQAKPSGAAPGAPSATTRTVPTATKSKQANNTGALMTVVPSHGTPTFDLWLDATTYLPIREQVRGPSGRVQSLTSYEWLTRSRANLAKLTLEVPAGFANQPARRRRDSH